MEQVSDKAKNIAKELESIVNVMGGGENVTYVSEQMTNMHRTLVQSFFGRFILPFVIRLARQYDRGYYDARNEATGKMCSLMWETIKKEYGYTDEDTPYMPLI